MMWCFRQPEKALRFVFSTRLKEQHMELVFIRHGQSEWNAKNLFTGWRDVPLSEQGLA